MGNLQVNILLANNPRERIEAGGIIPGAVNEGALGKVSAMVPTIEKMLPKLDSILGSLNALLADRHWLLLCIMCKPLRAILRFLPVS